jgi:hypothetical protein
VCLSSSPSLFPSPSGSLSFSLSLSCRFLWQSKADGSLHILYHNGAHGLHAFSKDGKAWSKSPTHSHAFELGVDVSDGSRFELSRRERPELLFDSSGRPRWLYNGVNTHGTALPSSSSTSPSSSLPSSSSLLGGRHGGFSHAFSMVQGIN